MKKMLIWTYQYFIFINISYGTQCFMIYIHFAWLPDDCRRGGLILTVNLGVSAIEIECVIFVLFTP